MRGGLTALGRIALLGVAVAIATVLGLGLSGDGLLTGDQRAESQTTSSPNIVLVMTDDLDKQSMNQLGGIRTVMGSNGATFRNAFVNYSLCCPSRASFLRGQYPHNHGIIDDEATEGEPRFRRLGRDQSTLATWLDAAGYHTKYVGKYLNGYRGPYIPPGWDEWFALSGDVVNNEVNDGGQSVTLAGNSTDAFAAEADDFIRRNSGVDPFFLVVGTRAPHRPPEVPARYLNSFADVPLPKPPNFDEADVSDKPAWVRSFPRVTQTQVNKEQTLYRDRLRSMLPVEDLLRQTITALQDTGELNNTYIFFTSDNGFHQGQHRLAPGDKKTPYEEDLGIPLMVRGPGVPGGAVRDQLVINNDLAPTIADLAGATVPAFVDGRSFTPLLTSTPPSTWRRAFLHEGWLPTAPPVPTNKGVRTQRHTFVEYDTGERELYDLAADPYQLESLPSAGNEHLYSELQARLDGLRDCAGAECRAAEWDDDITSPPPDTKSPRVASTVPGSNATAVAPSANPTANPKATFSEDMDNGTINATTFKLFKKGSATRLPAAISYSTITDTATLDPTDSLRAGATYKAVVTTGAKDLSGNPLDQNTTTTGLQQKAWYFTVSN